MKGDEIYHLHFRLLRKTVRSKFFAKWFSFESYSEILHWKQGGSESVFLSKIAKFRSKQIIIWLLKGTRDPSFRSKINFQGYRKQCVGTKYSLLMLSGFLPISTNSGLYKWRHTMLQRYEYFSRLLWNNEASTILSYNYKFKVVNLRYTARNWMAKTNFLDEKYYLIPCIWLRSGDSSLPIRSPLYPGHLQTSKMESVALIVEY